MFRAGAPQAGIQSPAKQLLSDVPTQFWIINLDDGFYGDSKEPCVRLEQIASIPLRALWEGFIAKTWEGPPQLNARGFLSVLFEASVNPGLDPAAQSSRYTEKNVFLIARRFCSMRCRFGFHFLSLDCLLGERERERFIIFQFKGGAANLARRIRRVHFVAELLARFDFATEIRDDTLAARMEERDEKTFLGALRVLGYLTMHTRQLDMIMGDESALTSRRFTMLEDMLALAARPPLSLP
jgi:pyruvate,water dikinase